jgi:hypothetical protein
MEVSGLLHTLATSPRVKSPGTYCVGSQVDPRASLDLFGEEKSLFIPAGIRTPDRPAYSFVAVLGTLS